MSAPNTPTPCPVDETGRDLSLFLNTDVDAEVQIVSHSRTPDDEVVSILFGDEQIRLEFYDVESLERLRDVADQAAQRLRAAIEKNTHQSDSGPLPGD